MTEEPTIDQTTIEGKEPTREEIIQWYDDQIEIAEKRHKLTILQSETVIAEAQRLEALSVMAKFRGEQPTSPETETEE
jgi:hypothetical protein